MSMKLYFQFFLKSRILKFIVAMKLQADFLLVVYTEKNKKVF